MGRRNSERGGDDTKSTFEQMANNTHASAFMTGRSSAFASGSSAMGGTG